MSWEAAIVQLTSSPQVSFEEIATADKQQWFQVSWYEHFAELTPVWRVGRLALLAEADKETER